MASPSDLEVRLVECDASDFTRLVAAFEEELERRYPGISDDDSSCVPDFVLCVVAYRGPVPIGCGALCELEARVSEVKRLFVVPEARGLGAARRILQSLEQEACSLGYSALRLGTGVRQPEALSLYESSGFVRIPLFGEYIEGGELCVCYEKAMG